jgi:predicted nucleic acid-binding protein
MRIERLPHGARVFADANVLNYTFSTVEPLHSLTASLIERSARQEIQVFTSASQAANVIHRAMIIEARSVLQVPSSKILAYLKDHPDAVRRLTRYRQIPGEFSRARVRILDVTYREIHASKQYRDDYGLLTDDSIMLAVMERHDLVDLAANDEDFKRIPGLRLWMPD